MPIPAIVYVFVHTAQALTPCEPSLFPDGVYQADAIKAGYAQRTIRDGEKMPADQTKNFETEPDYPNRIELVFSGGTDDLARKKWHYVQHLLHLVEQMDVDDIYALTLIANGSKKQKKA